MSTLAKLLKHEEGWRSRPYLCSQGYPTVGYGFKLGPKGSPIRYYNFELPQSAGEAWLAEHVAAVLEEFDDYPETRGALAACLLKDGVEPAEAHHSPRAAVLVSMAFQMGVQGLLQFKQTLKYVAQANWSNASANMLNSLWASQTPERAKRHAEQMLTGEWAKVYG